MPWIRSIGWVADGDVIALSAAMPGLVQGPSMRKGGAMSPMRADISQDRSRPLVLFTQLEERGSTHAAADAHGLDAVLDAQFLHVGQQGGAQLGTGAAQGVAQGNGAAVEVGLPKSIPSSRME
jgi:hypothetical protein